MTGAISIPRPSTTNPMNSLKPLLRAVVASASTVFAADTKLARQADSTEMYFKKEWAPGR